MTYLLWNHTFYRRLWQSWKSESVILRVFSGPAVVNHLLNDLWMTGPHSNRGEYCGNGTVCHSYRGGRVKANLISQRLGGADRKVSN